MIEEIAEKMADKLAGLPWISMVGGLARAQKLRVGEKEKTIPATTRGAKQWSYLPLTPDSSQSAIAYFEGRENRQVDLLSTAVSMQMQVTMRAIFWLNFSRLVPDSRSIAMSQAVVMLAGKIDDGVGVRNILVSSISEVPRSASIFAQYTYDEAETQYLMLPYDYFALDLTINYIVSPGCLKEQLLSTCPPC